MDVADKWRAMIQQMTIAALHEDEFLERVKRSAAYFEKTIYQVLSKPLAQVPNIKSQNKLAMKRLTENHIDLKQAWLSRRFLIQAMSQKTFTIAYYLRRKQHSLLDAMDADAPRQKGGKSSTRGRKNTKK